MQNVHIPVCSFIFISKTINLMGKHRVDILPKWRKNRSRRLYMYLSMQKPGVRIFKLLRDPGIDSKEPIPPAYVAWRANTITIFLLGS